MKRIVKTLAVLMSAVLLSSCSQTRDFTGKNNADNLDELLSSAASYYTEPSQPYDEDSAGADTAGREIGSAYSAYEKAYRRISSLNSFKTESGIRIKINGVSDISVYGGVAEVRGDGGRLFESSFTTDIYGNLGQLIEERIETEYSDGAVLYTNSVSRGGSDSKFGPVNYTSKEINGDYDNVSLYMTPPLYDSIKNFDRSSPDGVTDKIIFTMNTKKMLPGIKDRLAEYSLDGSIKINSYTVTVNINGEGYISSEATSADFAYSTGDTEYSGAADIEIKFTDINSDIKIERPKWVK